MVKKWTYYAVYAIMQIQFFRGVWEEIFNAKDVCALPGSDINLTCQIQEGVLAQMQWSKVTDKSDLIALYHPQYGFHCAQGNPCESQVVSVETTRNATKWILHLRNISSTFNGKYECSFTLYPEGAYTAIYNLLLQTPGSVTATWDEWRSDNTMEIEMNQTVEIPCFQNTTSEISPGFTFAWLVKDNGTQEALITHGCHVSSSKSFQRRVTLGAGCGLRLSPVQVHDDGRTFLCLLTVGPHKIRKSATTIKVLAKPEIPIIMENTTMDTLRERIFTCTLKNVFPKANLTWFIDGRLIQGDEDGIHITHEERRGTSGFSQLTSILRRMSVNEQDQSNNKTIWCVALTPGPQNSMWNTSSKIITFSLGSVNVPTDPPPCDTESILSSQPCLDNHTTSPIPWIPSETYSPVPSDASLTLHGIMVTKPSGGMSWPVAVAALLFVCTVLLLLAVRKWCQYQKEIMERPPPFKPPPPPIKYICIQEPVARDLPCHEMGTLQSFETLP